jgi:DNA-binding NtrC family response regulator
MSDTTIPRDPTAQAVSPVPSWGFVLLWSEIEPGRVGEIAFLRPFEPKIMGRGDAQIDDFATFCKHCPGAPLVPTTRDGNLGGQNLSRRQLRVRATAVGVEMEQIGRTLTYVNGEVKTRAVLQPGHTVLFPGQALLMCVRRLKTIPGPRGKHDFGGPDEFGLVGESWAAWQLRDAIARSAPLEHHLLLRGESGTGKELVARAIHRLSSRAKFPLVSRNIASLSPDILDAQIFGNRANWPNPGTPAFEGLFAKADRSILFLDEIGDCPLEVQIRLLRALESGEYSAVGEAITRFANVRVIGATHKAEALRHDFLGRFRDSIDLPPLRDRLEDIPLILRNYLLQEAHANPNGPASRFCQVGSSGEFEVKVHEGVIDHLVRREFPRNIRDLEEFIVTTTKMSDDTDELRLPSWISGSSSSPPSEPREEKRARGPRQDPTKEELLEAMAAEPRNVSGWARRLGVGRKVIYKVMDRYGIKKEETEP